MFQIVPHRATQSSVEVFLGVFYEAEPPEQCTLSLIGPDGTTTRVVDESAWQTLYGDGGDSIHHVRRTFRELAPACLFELVLTAEDGRVLARGSFETLPQRLPLGESGGGPERPFTIWLSSCFYSPRAPSGLEEMVRSVVRDARLRPHLKILAGDQVYLDFPQSKTIFFRQERLRQHFNDVYAASWTHPGFGELLSHGSNLFMADDHELWNNYPESLVRFLWPLRGAEFHNAWEHLAKERCAALQSVEPLQRIEIGAEDSPELVIMVAQTRLERTRGLYRIMSDAAMAELVSWIERLECPAVLALSQPVFSYSGNGDWNLSDYRQYREVLQPALQNAQQDLVVVTGDPHFGRIGVARFGEHDERQLIEVVASPLTLVTPLVGAERPLKPKTFPHYGPMSQRQQVEYPRVVDAYESGDRTLSEEHAMLLRFSRESDDKIRLRVLLRLARQETPALEWSWEATLRAPRPVAMAPAPAQ